MFIEIFLFFVSVSIALVAFKLINIDRYHFKNRNLKYRTLSYSLGNLFKMIIGCFTAPEMAKRTYNAFPNES